MKEEILSSTENATIYYTTDGSEPTTESMEYDGAIPGLYTVKAIAVKEDYHFSSGHPSYRGESRDARWNEESRVW